MPRDRSTIERYRASPHSRPITVTLFKLNWSTLGGLHGLDTGPGFANDTAASNVGRLLDTTTCRKGRSQSRRPDQIWLHIDIKYILDYRFNDSCCSSLWRWLYGIYSQRCPAHRFAELSVLQRWCRSHAAILPVIPAGSITPDAVVSAQLETRTTYEYW